MEKFDQKKYIQDYVKQTYKRYEIRVKKNDTNIINKLNSVKNVNAYILNLIKEDIENENIIKKIKKEKNI